MRIAIVAMLAWIGPASAQDLSVVQIVSPQSGCALGANENVVVNVRNFGPNLPAGASFAVSYTINAGSPVTENVVLAAPLLSNSMFGYGFTTAANLSTPGTYFFDASVSLAGDINPTNNARTGYSVTNTAPSVGGTVSGPPGPTGSGSLLLAGYTGSIVQWQQSEDGGLRWRALANTTQLQSFTGLREHTQFRALVRNGACAPALSTPMTVLSADPIFYAGFEP
jgi:hypothetical protein